MRRSPESMGFRSGRGMALLTVLLLLLPAGLSAQAGRKLTADDAALKSYTLTMANIRKLPLVARNLKAAVQADPSLANEDDDAEEPQTLADQIRQVESKPVYRKAVVQAGLTPRDYIMTLMTLMQASMYVSFAQQAPKGKPMEIPYNMNPANAELVRANQAEISKMKLGNDEEDGGEE